MHRFYQRVTDLEAGARVLAARRYGVIEVADGRLVAVHLRPLPKLLSLPELWPVGYRYHGRGRPNRCLIFYNQPRRFPNFLAVKYAVTTPGTPPRTVQLGMAVLDEIARIKRTDALLCDVGNSRISDRLMRRFGWQPHKPQRWHRNYIKRFYGEYPATKARAKSQEANDKRVLIANDQALLTTTGSR